MRVAASRGFTLLEMLVTLSIVGMLAAVTVPSFGAMINRQRLVMATNDLNLAFTLARSEALKRGDRVAVAPLVPGQWTAGWRVFVDADDDGVFDTDEQVLQVFSATDAGISIDAVGPGLDEVVSYNNVGFSRKPGNDGLVLGRLVVKYDDADPRTICFSSGRTRLVYADTCS